MTKVPKHELRQDSLKRVATNAAFAGLSESIVPLPRAVPCGNCATCTCGRQFDPFTEATRNKPVPQIGT